MKSVISTEESERFAALNAKIKAGLMTFVEVGQALLEVRDNRLYRATHSDFADYCEKEYGFARNYGNRLMEAAKVAGSVNAAISATVPIGTDYKIANEAQVREIKKVEPAKRAEVVTKAATAAKAESRPMTARDIKEAATDKESLTVEAEEVEPPRVVSSDAVSRAKRALAILHGIALTDPERKKAVHIIQDWVEHA